MKTYTLGQVIDKLQKDEIAIPVTSEKKTKAIEAYFITEGLNKFYYNKECSLHINPVTHKFEAYGSSASLAIVWAPDSSLDGKYVIMKKHDYKKIANKQ